MAVPVKQNILFDIQTKTDTPYTVEINNNQYTFIDDYQTCTWGLNASNNILNASIQFTVGTPSLQNTWVNMPMYNTRGSLRLRNKWVIDTFTTQNWIPTTNPDVTIHIRGLIPGRSGDTIIYTLCFNTDSSFIKPRTTYTLCAECDPSNLLLSNLRLIEGDDYFNIKGENAVIKNDDIKWVNLISPISILTDLYGKIVSGDYLPSDVSNYITTRTSLENKQKVILAKESELKSISIPILNSNNAVLRCELVPYPTQEYEYKQAVRYVDIKSISAYNPYVQYLIFYKTENGAPINVSEGNTSFGPPITYLGSSTNTHLIRNSSAIGFYEEPIGIPSNIFTNRSDIEYVDLYNAQSIKSIDSCAFYNCSNMIGNGLEFTFPTALETIGDEAFANCKRLRHIMLKKNLKNLSTTSFAGCTGLKIVYLNTPYLTADNSDRNLSQTFGPQVTFYRISSAVTTISHNKFENAGGTSTDPGKLNTLFLSSGLKYIGDFAFSNCPSLGNIGSPDLYEGIDSSYRIPISVEDCGKGVFRYCAETTPINNASLFVFAPKTASSGDPNTLIIPSNIKKIAGLAVSDCDYTNVSFNTPETLKIIHDGGFYNCQQLYKFNSNTNGYVVIPENVEYLGTHVFYNNVSIRNVSLGNSITNLGYGTFWNCSRLTNATVSVNTNIPNRMFKGCSNLETIYIGENVRKIEGGVKTSSASAFNGCNSLTTVTLNSPYLVSKNYKNESETFKTLLGDQVKTYKFDSSIVTIGDYAFANTNIEYSKSEINSDIGINVKKIGANSFYNCTNLKEVKISNNTTNISYQAFYNCGTNYPSFTLSLGSPNYSSLSYIGVAAFSRCNIIGTLSIPKNVETIDQKCFQYCTNITSVSFAGGNSLNPDLKIFEYAFDGCDNKSFTSIIIPERTSTVGFHAFWGKNISEVTIRSDKFLSKDHKGQEMKTKFYEDSAKHYKIESPAINIGAYAFNKCDNVEIVEIPNDILTIGTASFKDCPELETFSYNIANAKSWVFEFPNSLVSIGESAFENSHLDNIKFDIANSQLTTIGKRAFFWCDAPNGKSGTISIPDATEFIGESAFERWGKESMSYHNIDVSFGTSQTASQLTTISKKAFYDIALKGQLNIPNKTVYIGESAFAGSSQIQPNNIHFGTSQTTSQLKTIGAGAFEDCNGMSSGLGYFYGASGTLSFPNSLERINANAFNNFGINYYDIYVKFGTNQTDSNLNYIGQRAFYKCDIHNDLNIPNKTKTIDASAFYGCSNIYPNNIHFGTSQTTSQLKTIGAYAFSKCDGYYLGVDENAGVTGGEDGTLTLPNSLERIENGAFYDFGLDYYDINLNLGDQINSSLLYIGKSAFEDCDIHSSVNIPNKTKIIDVRAFHDCTYISNISIGTSQTLSQLSTIGDYAFYNCKTATGKLLIPNTTIYIGESAFEDCAKMTNLNFGSSPTQSNLKTIGTSAFAGCSSISNSIIFPNSTEYIGEYAFEKTNITSITCSVTTNGLSIYSCAFANCNSLTSVNLIENNFSRIYLRTKGIWVNTPSSGTGNSLLYIGPFAWCNNLSTVTIDYYIIDNSNLPAKSFYECQNLRTVNLNVSAITQNYNIADVFGSQVTTYNVQPNTNGTNVCSIKSNVFKECKELTTLNLHCTILYTDAIINCDNLTTVNLGNELEEFWYGVFSNCDSLTYINYNASKSTFAHCTAYDEHGTRYDPQPQSAQEYASILCARNNTIKYINCTDGSIFTYQT